MRGTAAISDVFRESPLRHTYSAVVMMPSGRTKRKNESAKTFRLESASTECFQADTDNSNRTMFRLDGRSLALIARGRRGGFGTEDAAEDGIYAA